MLKRTIPAIAAISLLAAFTVSTAASELDIQVTAKAAILYEPVTKTVLFEKNADDRMLIASTTKLMTALVALEHCSIEETVEVPKACEGVEGSSMYLKAGDKLSMRELLYGLMLESGNDAAACIAYHVSGSIEGFAKLMNDRAEKLGLQNTHFVNPHGLNAEGHYSSARDLAVIMAEAMDNPIFAQIASTKSISFDGRTYTNHNKLMWSYDGMVAGKTGYTKKAGRTLVTCAQRGGTRLICVTLSDPDDWTDHTRLYDAGFEGWELITPAVKGREEARIPVICGLAPDVGVTAGEGLSLLLRRGSEVETSVCLPEFVYAGVKAGDTAGIMTVTAEGRSYEIALYYSESVPRDESQRLRGLDRLRRYLGVFMAGVNKGTGKIA